IVLEPDTGLQRAHVVAQVELAGGPVAGQNASFHGFLRCRWVQSGWEKAVWASTAFSHPLQAAKRPRAAHPAAPTTRPLKRAQAAGFSAHGPKTPALIGRATSGGGQRHAPPPPGARRIHCWNKHLQFHGTLLLYLRGPAPSSSFGRRSPARNGTLPWLAAN